MNGVANTGTDLREVLRVGRQMIGARQSGIDWLSPLRERGAADVAAMPLPDRKDEAWRYTSLGFLEQTSYTPLLQGPFEAVQLSDIDHLLLAEHNGARLVFVNGYLAPGLSCSLGDPEGVLLSTLGGTAGDVPPAVQRQLDHIAGQRHVFAALNTALMSDGALIHVPRGVAGRHPIEILHISVGMEDPGICHPRHLILLDEGARAHVIERYCSLGDALYFNNAMVEIALGVDAELVHERLQEESVSAQHLTDLHVRLAGRSRYRLVQVTLGAAWSRTDVRVLFDGEGAEARLDGLMLARDRQLNDVHLDVRHAAARCTSRETFKSILDGRGRVVFDGRILVAEDAQKSDAMLTNHNLMLSRQAEVDTKPQLEIYADDVKCSHGTTVGELDPDMLFYMRSRGLGEGQARQILCHGFAQEVLERIGNLPLRARATSLLAHRLLETVQRG